MILLDEISFEKDNNKNNHVALNSKHQYHLTHYKSADNCGQKKYGKCRILEYAVRL
jgi:hypothetical protein